MDPLVWKAYTVPHLSTDQLPPLRETDTSASLAARAFPVINFVTLLVTKLDLISQRPAH